MADQFQFERIPYLDNFLYDRGLLLGLCLASLPMAISRKRLAPELLSFSLALPGFIAQCVALTLCTWQSVALGKIGNASEMLVMRYVLERLKLTFFFGHAYPYNWGAFIVFIAATYTLAITRLQHPVRHARVMSFIALALMVAGYVLFARGLSTLHANDVVAQASGSISI